MIRKAHVAPVVALWTAMGCVAQTHTPRDLAEVPQALPVSAAAASPLNESRIFGVIPDYQTITDSTGPVKPLTARQKWTLALKESVDPFNVLNAGLGAAFSQRGNQTPKYGEGDAAYARRFGAALADFGTQNFFSAGVLATLLHQDPRYYRKGPGRGSEARDLLGKPPGDRTPGFGRGCVQLVRDRRNDARHRRFQSLLSGGQRSRLGDGMPRVDQSDWGHYG